MIAADVTREVEDLERHRQWAMLVAACIGPVLFACVFVAALAAVLMAVRVFVVHDP